MQAVTLLRLLTLGTFLCGALGCGDAGDSAIVATVGPLTNRITQVVVSSTLDNKAATNMQILTPPTDSFAVELPSTKSGHLVLNAVGYDSDNCTQGSSTGAIDLPSGRTDLAMPLLAKSPRKCGNLDPCVANTLCATPKPQIPVIQSIWTVSPKDIWAVGLAATLVHYDGTSWTVIPPPAGVSENLFGVWGNAANNLWAVGAGGRIIYYNGTAWTAVPSSTTLTLYGVWGVSNTDVWAVGNATSSTTQGTFLHYDGSSWSPIVATGLGLGSFNSVWADSPSFIYACGVGGLLTRYNGTKWTVIDSGTTTISLHSVWGTPGGITSATVFATGDGGVILRVRYALDPGWSRIATTGTTSNLFGIHGDGTSVVYAVGTGGAIVRSDFPYDLFTAQNTPTTATLFGTHLGSNGLLWTGGGSSGSGFLGYLDLRP